MKKMSGSVFRPWDSTTDSNHQQEITTTVKTEQFTVDQQTVKKETEDFDEEVEDQDGRRQGVPDSVAGGHSALESGLAIAMRGLAGGRSTMAARWHLGSCLRGLVMGGGASSPPNSRALLTVAPPTSRLGEIY